MRNGGRVGTVLLAAGVGAAYYASAFLALRLALVEENVTPLWPPTGIALTAFLAFGSRVWPGVALGALAVNLPISVSAWAAAVTAAGNTLAPLIAAVVLDRLGFRRQIDRLRDAIAIVLVALGGMLLSATAGASTLVASGAIPRSDFPGAWGVWWTGDAMGILVVAPFLLSLRWSEPTTPTWGRRIEVTVLLVLVALVSFVVFRTAEPMRFLVVPLLVWAAWRFQHRGAAPAALIAAGVASWSAAEGAPAFQMGSLLEKMLSLQAYNAVVAFTSLFLAAMVADRLRARRARERSQADLERRVVERTDELGRRERQLAEAQRIAAIGSWQWSIGEDVVTWSDEMFRIHGHPPRSFVVSFDAAIAQIVPDHRGRVLRAIEEASVPSGSPIIPELEYRITRPDGTERTVLARGRVETGEDGRPVRLFGTVQDITDARRAEREHRIAVTLQRSLLPDRLPEIPGVALAARYVPATEESDIGGDWYDVVELPSGLVGLVVGDVAGHGLRAASVMGQLRMALRAYAVEEAGPANVVRRVHRLFGRVPLSDMATVVYLVLEVESGEIRFANAGHPPPLVVRRDGTVEYLGGALAPPLGAMPHADRYVDGRASISEGDTLVLFTDGLIERRGVSLDEGLGRLAREAAAAHGDLESLCDTLLSRLVGGGVEDDIAILVVRPMPVTDRPLEVRVPAEPHVLAALRRAVRRWLRAIDASEQDAYEVLAACGEACANVIQHAYGASGGTLELRFDRTDGEVQVTVRDFGTWREPSPGDSGWGLELMHRLMDDVAIDRAADGTTVTMRRRLRPAT